MSGLILTLIGTAAFVAVYGAVYFARSWAGLAAALGATLVLLMLGDMPPLSIFAGLAIIGSGGAFIVLARKQSVRQDRPDG